MCAVRVVSDQAFATWVEDAKKRFAANPDKNMYASAGGVADLTEYSNREG